MKNHNYLFHHGILGQKWGTRNGPPYPLDAEDHSASERKAGWRKSLQKTESQIYENASKRIKRTNPNYTEEQVSKATKNYIKAGKLAISIAALSLVTYAGIEAYKYGSTYFDGELKAGQILQRIERLPVRDINGEVELHDSFYATYDKGDNALYRKMLGDSAGANNLLARMMGQTPQIMQMEAVSPIKIANHKTAEKLYKEFYANYSPKHDVPDDLMKLLGAPKFGKGIPLDYKEFNRGLVYRGEGVDEFYSFLKTKGYSALVDINDQKYSGFNAKAPIIVFDKSAVKVTSVESYENYPAGRKAADAAVAAGKVVGIGMLDRPEIVAQTVSIGAMYGLAFAYDNNAAKAKSGAANRTKNAS